MFGYVTPCKMELKIKDYEKFKSYYCGLCRSIKSEYGNLPRMSLNYDMTFLAVLLDSLSESKTNFQKFTCIIHPFKKRISIVNNEALDYAAFCNVVLTYYKLLDNINDDKSYKSKVASLFLKKHIFKHKDSSSKKSIDYIEKSLNTLALLEKDDSKKSIDEISDAFADLTGYMISNYVNKLNLYPKETLKEDLYWLGYNLGKWIYIIDAWDDLEKDMLNNKFNAINKVYNLKGLNYKDFSKDIEERIDYLLVSCASQCTENLMKIPIVKNKELLYNILQFGLMEKMDIVFKRSECGNAKSL